MFGNYAGRDAYYGIGNTRHYANGFDVIVGKTSRSRKGTGLTEAKACMPPQMAEWSKNCVSYGLSTGEGLIDRVRDRVTEFKENKAGQRVEVEVDPGVSDKRILIVEEEFSRPLKVMGRAENTLSQVLRLSWDGRDLAVMTRRNPIKATEPHVSLIGHITIDELRRELGDTEVANGFGNRLQFYCAKRSQELPFGGRPDAAVMEQLRHRFASIIRDLPRGEIRMDVAAQGLWEREYSRLTEDRPGMFGALTARSEAHVCRNALKYAMLDQSRQIGVTHLKAALELLRYSTDSVRLIFGDALGDPVADRILVELRQAAPDKMTRTEIFQLFGKNLASGRIGDALAILSKFQLARMETTKANGAGRPAELWRAC
jgi:hypothetical protein